MRLPHAAAALVSALMLVLTALPALAGGAPSETIVLINESSADSVRVGERYVEARQIPPTNVCRVRCTTKLVVSRVDFVRDVVTPLRALLRQDVSHDGDGTLRDRARFVVLTQGMPIRADGPGGPVSTAEMLVLLDTMFCGQEGARLPRIRNPYTRGVAPGPADDGAQILLVTALISSTPDEALALIDRSVASDGTAPESAHWVYQDARGNAGVRNDQYDAAREALEKRGHTTEHVAGGKEAVLDRERVMGYMSGGSYSALSPDGVAANAYLPGAICDMLQSFGAAPQNFNPDGTGGTQFPVTHMVRAGITGVHGTVAEPYNVAFPPADLFTPYAQGFTLAETFHQKIPFRYWMNLVIGDPLCAPYAERLEIDTGDGGAAPQTAMIGAVARGAVRIEGFVDGISVGSFEGESGSFTLPPGAFADGAHRLLIEATGPGPHEPRSWKTLDVSSKAPAAMPRSLPPSIVPGVPLTIPLTRPPNSHAVTLTHGADEIPLATTLTPDGLVVDVAAARIAPFAGEALDAELTLDGNVHRWQPGVGPVRLRVRAHESVTAGEPLEIRVVAEDAAGAPLRGWSGRLELHSTTPPVRWARAELADGEATLRFASGKAGRMSLEVRDPGTTLTSSLDLTVEPGAPHHATTPLSRMPLGQAMDVPIRFEDRFGNPVTSPDEEIEVAFPDDPHARGAGKVIMAGKSGILRDVILTRPGRQRMVVRAGSKTWSQPQEGVDVRPDFVRAWLVTRAFRGPDAAALFDGDPSAGLRTDGGVVDGRLFRRLRDGDATVDLPAAGSRDGDAAVAVAFVDALDDTQAVLRLSAAARVRVLLDGREVFGGVPDETNPRNAPKDVTELSLTKGTHRLTVVAERKGRFGFRLALGKGKQPLAPTLRVVPGTGETPDTACVSGRVLRANGRPCAGARVELVAGDSERRVAETAADGSWFVAGVEDGDVTVRLVSATGLDRPIERVVSIEGEHAVDVDFRVTDRLPPSITITSPAGLRAGRTLVLEADIRDEGGVERTWLEIAGERLATNVRRDPWRLEADVARRPRGSVDVVVAAVDGSGNEARSAALTVTLVDDDAGPTITLRGLSRNGLLRKPTKVTATIRDPIGVAEVVFLVGDVAQGQPRTALPYDVTLEPSTLESGRHTLVCIARDRDGNETRKTLPFRVK